MTEEDIMAAATRRVVLVLVGLLLAALVLGGLACSIRAALGADLCGI